MTRFDPKNSFRRGLMFVLLAVVGAASVGCGDDEDEESIREACLASCEKENGLCPPADAVDCPSTCTQAEAVVERTGCRQEWQVAMDCGEQVLSRNVCPADTDCLTELNAFSQCAMA